MYLYPQEKYVLCCVLSTNGHSIQTSLTEISLAGLEDQANYFQLHHHIPACGHTRGSLADSYQWTSRLFLALCFYETYPPVHTIQGFSKGTAYSRGLSHSWEPGALRTPLHERQGGSDGLSFPEPISIVGLSGTLQATGLSFPVSRNLRTPR